MQREGFDIARCTVGRLMKQAGIQGVIRGKPHKTEIEEVGTAYNCKIYAGIVKEASQDTGAQYGDKEEYNATCNDTEDSIKPREEAVI